VQSNQNDSQIKRDILPKEGINSQLISPSPTKQQNSLNFV